MRDYFFTVKTPLGQILNPLKSSIGRVMTNERNRKGRGEKIEKCYEKLCFVGKFARDISNDDFSEERVAQRGVSQVQSAEDPHR